RAPVNGPEGWAVVGAAATQISPGGHRALVETLRRIIVAPVLRLIEIDGSRGWIAVSVYGGLRKDRCGCRRVCVRLAKDAHDEVPRPIRDDHLEAVPGLRVAVSGQLLVLVQAGAVRGAERIGWSRRAGRRDATRWV